MRAHVLDGEVELLQAVGDVLLMLNGMDGLFQLLPGLLTIVLRKVCLNCWERRGLRYDEATGCTVI